MKGGRIVITGAPRRRIVAVGPSPRRPLPAAPAPVTAGADDVRARLAEIERHLADATPGTHRRDCAGRIFATMDGEELQIGEAYAEGDARLWRHAATDIRWLVDELKRRTASI